MTEELDEKQPKFTPGPWKAHLNVPSAMIPGHIVKADHGAEFPIASIWEGGGTHGKGLQIANARLIAAAPSLYTFLQKIYLDYEDDCGCECNTENCCAVVGQRCAKCHAFIALQLVDGPQKETD